MCPKPVKTKARGFDPSEFGCNVFGLKTMRNYLPEHAYNSLTSTIVRGEPIDPVIADEVAEAMRTWAVERGVTHFTHWFLPLTGTTAGKHEAFLSPDGQGGAISQFSGRELIQGEPDASNFPNGGLRATFEARGYTAWDPTSPAFIMETAEVAILYVPTIFCGHNSEALDKKTPLLRSQRALETQLKRMARLFGIDDSGHAYATLGAEQEYFLVDLKMVGLRPDLKVTGRTLFGRTSPRQQQMEDHYFGHVKPRVLAFMDEVDQTLWRLGIPAKMRHNEAAPSQFEVAPVFEEQNLAVDHNMLTMLVLQEVAARHGFLCLLHEKPFAGINGSGKHNNWSPTGPDGRNWLRPGKTPHENAVFLAMLTAIVSGVDKFAHLLRATIATAGNDHRLGSHEAPPAIISVYLGEQLTDIFSQIMHGGARSSRSGGTIRPGIPTVPTLPRDTTDRNRTSPLAFTGNKFELRAVGSFQSCAGPNVAFNALVTWGIDELCTALEARIAEGVAFDAALQSVLSTFIREHKRILFDGDNYSEAWRQKAAKRGLPNAATTPEALEALIQPEVIELFARYDILSERELRARHGIYLDIYRKSVLIEAECALNMVRTLLVPAGLAYAENLRRAADTPPISRLRDRVDQLNDRLLIAAEHLETAIAACAPEEALTIMAEARRAADELEGLVPAAAWPLPSYAEMLLLV